MRRGICGCPYRGNLEFEGRTQQEMVCDAIDWWDRQLARIDDMAESADN